jgi:hypothetical protein
MNSDFGAYERIPIGKTLYLYRRRNQPGQTSRDLAILAHGAYVAETDATAEQPDPQPLKSMKVPKGATVYFYTPEAETFKVNWQYFANRKYLPVRVAKEGDSIPNYFLQKLESVAYADYEAKLAGDKTATPYEPMMRFGQINADERTPPMDIVTIRRRFLLDKDLDLRRVLSKLNHRGYTYDRVHAGFCTAAVNRTVEPKIYEPAALTGPLRDDRYEPDENGQVTCSGSRPVRDMDQIIADLDRLMKTCEF